MTTPTHDPRNDSGDSTATTASDLVAAYALDAVDGDERLVVDTMLERDPALRDELDEHRAVLAVLAEAIEHAPSTPSPAVWEGIQTAIAGGRSTAQVVPEFTPARQARRRRWVLRLVGAVAATALAAAAFFGVRLATLESGDLVAAANQLRDDPSAEVMTLTASGGLAVEVVLSADGVGYVFTDALPELAPGRTYQLWAINDNGVISAGIFGRNGVAPFHVDGAVAGLAITEEVSGGVVSSENDPVALWLSA